MPSKSEHEQIIRVLEGLMPELHAFVKKVAYRDGPTVCLSVVTSIAAAMAAYGLVIVDTLEGEPEDYMHELSRTCYELAREQRDRMEAMVVKEGDCSILVH